MRALLLVLALSLVACGDDSGPAPDASTDASTRRDGPTSDARPPPRDGATPDGGTPGGALACTLVDCAGATGDTVRVTAGGDLQAALDAAQPGDTIELAAGAVFRGNFVLRNRSGTGCITVRTSTPDADLPAGTAVTPADAPSLARLETASDLPALRTEPGAHHIRLVGLELAAVAGAAAFIEVVALGSTGSDQTTMPDVPHHIAVERSYVHGIPGANIKRGIGLNSASTCVVDSWIDEIHSDMQDSQAIGGFNGPGPYEIFGNHLEGSAENIMFGGAVPAIADLVPSDIAIRRNHFIKPLAWRAGDPGNTGYTPWVKNLFECKIARNVVLEGNVMENNWAGADQHGYAIVITPRGEGGAAPWAVCENIRVESNLILHVGGGLQIAGRDSGGPSQQTNRIVIRNNLIADIRADYALDIVRVLQFNDVIDLVVDHNTFVYGSPGGYDLLRAFGENSTGFEYSNNVVPFGSGLWADCGTNAAALTCRLPGAVLDRNVFIGGSASGLPGMNFFPADVAATGFADHASGGADFHGYALAPGSAYAGMGTAGSTPGIDAAVLDAALGR